MLNWLKKQLGIEELQAQVASIQAQRDAAVKALEEREQELEVFRKQDEADQAKYNSDEPWVEIRSEDFNEARGFRIELDWNDAFIRQLKEAGIKGGSDEEVIQKWLALLYQNLIEKLETKVIDKKDETKGVSDYV